MSLIDADIMQIVRWLARMQIGPFEGYSAPKTTAKSAVYKKRERETRSPDTPLQGISLVHSLNFRLKA